jgi:hypothetical protein
VLRIWPGRGRVRTSRRVVSLEETDASEMRTSSIIALIMEAARTSETSVYFNDITRRYNPQGSNLHTRLRENLKSHTY